MSALKNPIKALFAGINNDQMGFGKIKFSQPNNNPFFMEVKRRVDEYFKEKSTTRFANGAMIFKMILIFALFIGSYAALLSNYFSPGWLPVLALLFGFSMALIAFNIGHDASHGALFKNPKLNYIFSYSFNLLGVNRYIWDIKHNISHHTFTNIPGYDMDIEQIRIARLVDHVPLKWFYRFQHIYVPLLYPFASLYLLFLKDFQMFATKKYGNSTFINHPRKEYFILIISKIIYFTYALIIPILVIDLPVWQILMGFVMVHLVLGVFLAIILFPVHVLEEMPFPKPDDDGMIHNSWIIHQVETTTNYGADSRILHWISGGLNTHIAHHIFPTVCHIHYYNLTKIIRSVAKEYNIPFQDNTLPQAFASHFSYLKTMGRQKEFQKHSEVSMA